jgi:hypothetical protein
MVRKVARGWKLLPVIVLASLLLLLIPTAGAQGLGEEQSFTLQEEYRIEVNDVGDAHITDTITYDAAWFDEYGYLFEENPNLLSRRYRSDSNVGEVENFDTDIDSRDATITVFFDTPGLAYNSGDKWNIYGYGNYESSSEDQDEVVLEASWVLTNEFTLFESMPLDEKVVIDLPDGTKNADFDKGTGTIEYELPYVSKGGGVLADNKTVFTIVFALVMALSLLLFIYVFTRKTGAPVLAATAAAVTPGVEAGVPPVAVAAPPGAPPVAPAGPKFCKRCGHPRSTPEERFCRNCGAPFE